MNGKRLFWTSLIIVELVLVYVLWHPHRERPVRSAHRTAPIPTVTVPSPQPQTAQIVIASNKPAAGIHEHRAWRKIAPVVNAGLISREPIPAKPLSSPPATLGPLESFWCHLSTVESQCDCKGKTEEQANLLMR